MTPAQDAFTLLINRALLHANLYIEYGLIGVF